MTKVRIIGAPVDLGASRRGTDMGPSAMRAARLHSKLRALGHDVQDAGNVFASEMEENADACDIQLRYANEILAACGALADKVDKAVSDGALPLVLGGDHSIAIGTQAGLARHSHDRGLIWFDAHADINTVDTSPSGNIHGMPVSAILGMGHPTLADFDSEGPKLPAGNVVLVGLRDVDPKEAELLASSGVTYYTMRDVDEMGIGAVVDAAMKVAGRGKDGVHLSFDLDAVDPQWAPGTGTKVHGGLTYREAHFALEKLAAWGRLTSLEFVEVNPLLDVENKTGQFAVGLIASALGKSIVPD